MNEMEAFLSRFVLQAQNISTEEIEKDKLIIWLSMQLASPGLG